MFKGGRWMWNIYDRWCGKGEGVGGRRFNWGRVWHSKRAGAFPSIIYYFDPDYTG